MIRPVTCLCMVLAGSAGLYLYSVKQQARVLDHQIEHTLQEARDSRERTRMLSAEWTLLNEPGRLQDLAERYLHLEPMKPNQFVQQSSLADHLPAVAALTHDAPDQMTDAATDADDQGQISGQAPVAAVAAPDTVAPSVVAMPAKAELPVLAIAHLAPKHVAPAPHVVMAEASVVRRHDVASNPVHEQPAHVLSAPANGNVVVGNVVAVRHDLHQPLTQAHAVMTPKTIIAKPLPLAVPRRPAHGMLNTMNAPMPYPAPSLVMHTQPLVQTAAMARPGYGSALGMVGSALPPPVPVATER